MASKLEIKKEPSAYSNPGEPPPGTRVSSRMMATAQPQPPSARASKIKSSQLDVKKEASVLSGAAQPPPGGRVSSKHLVTAEPPAILVTDPSAQRFSVLSAGRGGRQQRRSLCHVHPATCRCERCPCPSLTKGVPGASPSGSVYAQLEAMVMRELAGARFMASDPMDPYFGARPSSGVAAGYPGRLFLGRPPPFRRPPPEPLVMARVARSAGRYPTTRGGVVRGLTPPIGWANYEKGLPLPPGCPRNMMRSLPMTYDYEEDYAYAGPAVRAVAPRWLSGVDPHTCTFPQLQERGDDLQCATCAQPKEAPAEAPAKGKKRRRDDAEAAAEADAAAPDAAAEAGGADAQVAPEEAAPDGAEAGAEADMEGGMVDESVSKAVLVGSRAALDRGSRASAVGVASTTSARMSPSGSGMAAVPASRTASGSPVAPKGTSFASMGAVAAAAAPPSSVSMRRTSGALSRLDSAMPLPEMKKSTVSARPPLEGIRESVTSTPVADTPQPAAEEPVEEPAAPEGAAAEPAAAGEEEEVEEDAEAAAQA